MLDKTVEYLGWIDGPYAAFSLRNEENSLDMAMRWLERYAMTTDGTKAEIIEEADDQFPYAYRLIDPGPSPIETRIRFDVLNSRTCVVMTTSIDGFPRQADIAEFFDSVILDDS